MKLVTMKTCMEFSNATGYLAAQRNHGVKKDSCYVDGGIGKVVLEDGKISIHLWGAKASKKQLELLHLFADVEE